MNKPILQLGRVGDLINLLPIAYADHREGNTWDLIVGKEYAGVLHGCKYLNPIITDFGITDLKPAMEFAEKKFPGVRSAQVLGDTDSVKRFTYGPAQMDMATTDSFAKEPYKLLGRMDLFKSQPRPVFDRRSPKREQAIWSKAYSHCNARSAILVACGGVTSPFPYKELLFELLRRRFRTSAVIDIDKIRGQYVYDLLGLFERCKCLVTADSSLLHLAYAVDKLPVVALIQDRPTLWHGSPWRTNHIAHIRYKDFPFRAVEMLEAIERLGDAGDYFYAPTYNPGGPRILHVWNGYELNHSDTKERHAIARKTWEREYLNECWVETKVEPGAFGRDSKSIETIKDHERWPFLKDVLRIACYRSKSDADIICLTRSHVRFPDNFTSLLIQSPMPTWSHRWIRNGSEIDGFHPACDLFAFTVGWLKKVGQELPELLMARDSYWNRALLDVCRRNGGAELRGGVFMEKYEPLKGVKPGGMREAWNETYFKEYEQKHGEFALYPRITEQLPGVTVPRLSLRPNAYNPSIVHCGDRVLMAHRWHDSGDASTTLAIAELDDDFRVKSTKPLQVPHGGGSEEDPHFFVHKGELYLSYVDSTYPTMPPKAVVKYGKLIEDTVFSLSDIRQVKYGKNDGSACEKNWTFFDYKDQIYFIYQCWPEHRVVMLRHGVAIGAEHVTDGLTWSWGTPRGGTPPVFYQGKLLRFFHSGLDNEPLPWKRRYYVGCMLLEPEPPFAPITISKEPILRGSEADEMSAQERASCGHFKGQVVFPAGIIEREGGWTLSVGCNDSSCVLVNVGPEDLKL